MDVKKTVIGVCKRLGALIGILIAITLLINLSWFDEDLHPDLEALMAARAVAMDGNAYPLIVGFTAADDRDAEAAGLAVIDRLRERFANGERVTLAEDEHAALLGNPDPAPVWNERYPGNTCNARFELDCAERLVEDIGGTGIDDDRIRILLRRYEALLQADRFEETHEYDAYTPIPPYGAVLGIAKIRLANGYQTHSTPAFLEDVATDVRFWKRMLRDGHSLIAKMVALAGLRNDADFLSMRIRDGDLTVSELESISRVLPPLTAEERNIHESFLAELRIALLSDKSLAVLTEGPSPLYRLALQENATLNEYYFTKIVPLQLRAALSASEYFDRRAFQRVPYEVRKVPPPLYNLGGKLALDWMNDNLGWTGYISRSHDLDGRIALVLLQAEIARNPNRRPEDVIDNSVYRNPYTLEPMDFDPTTGRIGFDCLGNPSDVCAVALHGRGL